MKVAELHSKLQRPYKTGMECGVFKSKDSKQLNIHYVIPPAPPEILPEGLSYKLVSEAITALGRLPSYQEMDDLDKLINYLFVRREAVQSSRMEGTWSTIDEILTPQELNQNETHDTASVRGYAHALEKIYSEVWKKKERVFNEKLIQDLHKEIMQKDPRYLGRPGKIRAPGEAGSVVHIGGLNRPEESIYNPTPPEYVKDSLSKVLQWFSNRELAEKGDAGAGLTLPVRMAIGHSHFEAVHPFPDGNGRVGRSLWPLQMISAGSMPLYLSGYIEMEKVKYSEALQAAQKKLEYGKIIDFIARAIISSAAEMDVTKSRLLSLPEKWLRRGEFRKNSAAERALHVILKYPIFNMLELQRQLGCATQAAANAIHQLEKSHIIRERTGNKRNRIFAAEEVILLLARDHGSDADLALEKAGRILR